ncbi:ArsR/SmtB family transcription factor [Pseudodesulfovibrio sediminis]|uniref:Transcriptional regulator n=1 Tax=Pseudodesulfovibrio sediminis TaxID=2810563 RepID=A0ABM7P4Q1_9BACT|nr:metalloregulator ArsR/SmtB family transcription factor [Pseudodesulfovibrio sediminis]BCS87850.1 transcriptional regulator [Pseudodesulfovibrio sediminis]
MHQPIKPLDETFLADICKALSHPARIRILKHLLAEEGCICGRIVEIMPLAQSTVSQHLKILKETGLVRGEVDGPKTCYCVDRKKLAKFNGLMENLLADTDAQEVA